MDCSTPNSSSRWGQRVRNVEDRNLKKSLVFIRSVFWLLEYAGIEGDFYFVARHQWSQTKLKYLRNAFWRERNNNSLPNGEETFWFISVMKPGNCCWCWGRGAAGWKLCCAGLLKSAMIESFDILVESWFALPVPEFPVNPSFKSAPKKLLWSLLRLVVAMPLLLLLAGAELNPKKSKSEEWLLVLEVESPEKTIATF